MQQSQQQIFNNQWIVQKRISSGSFGVVLLGYDKDTKQEVAIKIEKEENEEVKSLEREVEVLNRLNGCDGTPKLYWSGEQDDYNVLIIQLLGKDLAHYAKNKKKFSIKTTLQLGIQITNVLQNLHNCGVVHRDLKPENILLGLSDESQKVYLVDFGISKIYRDNNGRHIPFRDNKPFIGTTRYASLAAHKGYEIGRKDDLESMMYVLLYFLKGQLPWQNMQNVTDEERTLKVGELKHNANLKELCKDLPNELVKILEYLKTLQFRSDPDYALVISLFQQALDAANIIVDNYFDWDPQEQIPRKSSLSDIQRQTTLQVQSNVDMKKSMDKQGSKNYLQQNSNNFLIPPEPKSTQLKRQDSRQQTVSSAQGSMMLSTYNSMNPQYQNSMKKTPEVLMPTPPVQQKSQLKQVMSMQEESNHRKENQQLHKTSTALNPTRTDTIGYDEYDCEENFKEQPLFMKYNLLKKKQVHIKRSSLSKQKGQSPKRTKQL